MMRDTRAAFRRWGMTVCAGLVLLGVGSCGSGGTYPVHGRLEYEDTHEPVTQLAGFQVTFTSQALGKSAIGMVREDGTFSLTSVKADDGAFPGRYKVIIDQPHRRPERPDRGSPVIDVIYEDPSRTPLEVEVKPQSDNEFTFPLRRFKPRLGEKAE